MSPKHNILIFSPTSIKYYIRKKSVYQYNTTSCLKVKNVLQCIQMREISYNKKEHSILLCWMLPYILWLSPKSQQLMSQVIFFYISTTNSINNKRKIIITKDKIKKSFLFIISPPFLKKKSGNHPTIEHSLHISITNHDTNYNDILSHFVKIKF